ncbi:MAG: biopolymer transporter ExbD [Verrucomicrobiota bacterium]|nr:biopolymer transporter ExbD [Opitutales bacterium]MEC7393672.1 biopolymer transporter ExbD [Verrucomicrobiota bacterium]MEC7401966.1 biopolymer transporter ExbD [Verrucomicrobiota bacterium]MEC7626838.1 biopolymer transporter ExbD [Verrucomicrobiota bacterium]MEC8657366.1 biopolymer transporter ExbD [Verrucomicrobiota bacterium]|tara:strand:- start:9360 stop:9779 length:420 start_codon:yes stop_codon:yes gene_type:complete
MARDFKRKNKLAVISDLNVTPLIDLAFSLLIIFMITTPVIEQYNRIDLPDQPSEQDQPLPEIDDEFITIDAEGTYHWGQVKVSKDELEERLDRIAASSGEQPVIHLRGDRSLRYQKIFDVINMLKARNLTKLSLDTKAI